MFWNDEKITHGIDDVNSARDSATQVTNRHGIIHPNTIPRCPATAFVNHFCRESFDESVPVTKGKKNVVETAAHTPIIENANPIACTSYDVKRNSKMISNGLEVVRTYREIASKLALVT